LSLAGLIGALSYAGIEAHVEDVLDALWLARHLGGQTFYPTAEVSSDLPLTYHQPQADIPRGSPARGFAPNTPNLRPSAPNGMSSELPLYQRGHADPKHATRKASATAIAAARALPNSLALGRALRPFRQRWQSTQDFEIDEEGTVEASAAFSGVIHPVLRPRAERWYVVDVVTEDDAAMVLWRDTLGELSRVLRNTGAFLDVRVWRLRLPSQERDELKRAATFLESTEGARVSPRLLTGTGTRHLILFATHGASSHWSDGSYADVLKLWLKTASVALLQLMPVQRWEATALGPAQGTCGAERPGQATGLIDAEPFWWNFLENDDQPRAFVPIVALDADHLAAFSGMQMARGRRVPIVFLDQSRSYVEPRHGALNVAEIPKILAALRAESPDAFRLAIYLASSPFTLPLARLIQEIKFESAPPQSLIAEILLSGLVIAHSQPESTGGPDTTYFEIRQEAREILLQGLRRADAELIARRLEEELSRHIQTAADRARKVQTFFLDDEGPFAVPVWARPFARVARALLGEPETRAGVAELIGRFVAEAAPDLLAEASRLSQQTKDRIENRASPALWSALTRAGLVSKRADGRWQFLPDIADALRSYDQSRAVPVESQTVAQAIVVSQRGGPDLPPLADVEVNAALFARWLSETGADVQRLSECDKKTFDRIFAATVGRKGSSRSIRRRFYLYFGGHTSENSEGLLLAIDGGFVPLAGYLAFLRDAASFDEIIVLIDNVAVSRSPMSVLKPGLPVIPSSLGAPRQSSLVISGGSPDIATPSLTALVLRGLRGEAADRDGSVKSTSLARYLQDHRNLRDERAEMPKIALDGREIILVEAPVEQGVDAQVRIRSAVPGDLDALIRLQDSNDLPSQSNIGRLLNSPSARVIVAEGNGQLLGVTAVVFSRNFVARLAATIITPGARGQGLAAQLLAAAESNALDRHCHVIRAEMNSSNEASIHRFLQSGYRKVDFYPEGGTKVRLEKDLVKSVVEPTSSQTREESGRKDETTPRSKAPHAKEKAKKPSRKARKSAKRPVVVKKKSSRKPTKPTKRPVVVKKKRKMK
jgi:GNAT superfamily N-acetyltransferase